MWGCCLQVVSWIPIGKISSSRRENQGNVQKYDADESGFISWTELRQMLKDMGKDNPCQLDGFMAFVDADGDEKITMEELLKKYKPK